MYKRMHIESKSNTVYFEKPIEIITVSFTDITKKRKYGGPQWLPQISTTCLVIKKPKSRLISYDILYDEIK